MNRVSTEQRNSTDSAVNCSRALRSNGRGHLLQENNQLMAGILEIIFTNVILPMQYLSARTNACFLGFVIVRQGRLLHEELPNNTINVFSCFAPYSVFFFAISPLSFVLFLLRFAIFLLSEFLSSHPSSLLILLLSSFLPLVLYSLRILLPSSHSSLIHFPSSCYLSLSSIIFPFPYPLPIPPLSFLSLYSSHPSSGDFPTILPHQL